MHPQAPTVFLVRLDLLPVGPVPGAGFILAHVQAQPPRQFPEAHGDHPLSLDQKPVHPVIVGDIILPLVDAAADEGIKFIDVRHEGAAMHMADGYARITGRPAVAMFTGGPGFANAISGLPAIYTSESPVIFVAGSADLPEKGMTTFQEIDQVTIAAPVTNGSWLIHDRRRIPEYVATAFRTAMSGRPGPVHLTLPIDIQEQAVSEEELPPYLPRRTATWAAPRAMPG